DFFRDPALRRLIALALADNPNLRAAVLNVEKTRAQYDIQRDVLIPQPDVTAGGSRQRQAFGFGGTGGAFTYSQYSVNVGLASYELDLFGRVRSEAQAALETYFSTIAARRGAQIALVAQVATAYLSEEEAAAELAVARRTVQAARSAYDLTRANYKGGVLSEIDLDTAQAELQAARITVAAYEQQWAEASDNVVLLVGRPVPEALTTPRPFDPHACLAGIPAGLPSDLLEQRPDIVAAEHALKGANADIGAARAALFPSITLTGSYGTSSTTLRSLFAPGSEAWNFSPQIAWPIFLPGPALSALRSVKSAELIAAANYQLAVETAFREVADALAVRATVAMQLDANRKFERAVAHTFALTLAGYRKGVDSLLDVVSARQTLDSARLDLIQSEYARLFNLITLYQDLGGGWTRKTVRPARPAH
ncbi:MAG: efflux transporter outer membrane subunit, partial [Opitutaceae bacterium]